MEDKKKIGSPLALLSEAVDIYKKNAFFWSGIVVFVSIVSVLLMKYWTRSGPNPPFSATAVVQITSFFLSSWTGAIFAVSALEKNRNNTSLQNIKESFRFIIPIALTVVLQTLILLSGTLMLVIPAIVFIVWFSPYLFVIADSGTWGVNALLKSKEYTKGYRLAVLGRHLLVTFPFTLATIIFSVFLSMNHTGYFTPGYFAYYLVISIVSPIITIYVYLIYRDLKKIKDLSGFVPSNGWKIGLILLAIAGPILIFLFAMILGLIVTLFSISKNEFGKSRDTQRLAEIVRIQYSLQGDYADNGKYPASISTASKIITYTSDGQTYTLCEQFETLGKKCFTEGKMATYSLDQ